MNKLRVLLIRKPHMRKRGNLWFCGSDDGVVAHRVPEVAYSLWFNLVMHMETSNDDEYGVAPEGGLSSSALVQQPSMEVATTPSLF